MFSVGLVTGNRRDFQGGVSWCRRAMKLVNLEFFSFFIRFGVSLPDWLYIWVIKAVAMGCGSNRISKLQNKFLRETRSQGNGHSSFKASLWRLQCKQNLAYAGVIILPLELVILPLLFHFPSLPFFFFPSLYSLLPISVTLSIAMTISPTKAMEEVVFRLSLRDLERKPRQGELEMYDDTESAIRKQGGIISSAQLPFFLFHLGSYLIWSFCLTRVSLPTSAHLIEKKNLSHTCQKIVSTVILNPVKLTVKVNHHDFYSLFLPAFVIITDG